MELSYNEWIENLKQFGVLEDRIPVNRYLEEQADCRLASARLKEITKGQTQSTARMTQGLQHLVEAIAA